MTQTKIEWCDTVWNPVTGCTKVSEGCRNCYAERIAKRFWKGRKFTDVRCHEDRLGDPVRWKNPRKIFVNSMSDLFHADVPIPFIANVFAVMHLERRHTFMVLTKRPERMRSVLASEEFAQEYMDCMEILSEHSISGVYDPERNVWLGVSVENQAAADERIPLLLQTPAAVRFVSIEPMIGPVDFRLKKGSYITDALTGWMTTAAEPCIGNKLDWVICGAESGPGARPFDLDWARSLRDQCQYAGVPFFLKQARIDGELIKMPALDGVVWDQFPERRETSIHRCVR